MKPLKKLISLILIVPIISFQCYAKWEDIEGGIEAKKFYLSAGIPVQLLNRAYGVQAILKCLEPASPHRPTIKYAQKELVKLYLSNKNNLNNFKDFIQCNIEAINHKASRDKEAKIDQQVYSMECGLGIYNSKELSLHDVCKETIAYKYLSEHFGESPRHEPLLHLARFLSVKSSLPPLNRAEARNKSLLICWFNRNWALIFPVLQHVPLSSSFEKDDQSSNHQEREDVTKNEADISEMINRKPLPPISSLIGDTSTWPA